MAADDAATQDLLARQAEVQYLLRDANLALQHHTADTFDAALACVDHAAMLVHMGKWMTNIHAGFLDGYFTGDPTDETPTEARRLLDEAGSFLQDASGFLQGRTRGVPDFRAREVSDRGTEILFVEDIPLVATVSPVLALAGSSQDMGRQYAAQMIQVFGRWILGWTAQLDVAGPTGEVVRHWTEHLRAHAPELVDMAVGIADGAERAGLSMTVDQAVTLFTGTAPPLMAARARNDGVAGTYGQAGAAGYSGGFLDPGCSGGAAWGDRTRDGGLYAVATTDHDASFVATILAHPDEGHPFVHTPFSANGYLPRLGHFPFAGHPGVNAEGVAFVHHGGGSHYTEAAEEWGYGLRRGAAILHALRFCDSAAAARDFELSLPIGDGGTVLGNPGGFWADPDGGFVIESRSRVNGHIVRDRTIDANGRGHDFLYANNNMLSADNDPALSDHVFGTQGLVHDPIAGWVTRQSPKEDGVTDAQGYRRFLCRSSEGRNRFLFRELLADDAVDAAAMHRLIRRRNVVPILDPQVAEHVWQSGDTWPATTGHRGNAFTAVVSVSGQGQVTYEGCIGPPTRFSHLPVPGHGFHYFDETNAFWRLTLREALAPMCEDAAREADRRIRVGEATSTAADADSPRRWLERARAHRRRATHVDDPARRLRELLRAQVQAQRSIDFMQQ